MIPRESPSKMGIFMGKPFCEHCQKAIVALLHLFLTPQITTNARTWPVRMASV